MDRRAILDRLNAEAPDLRARYGVKSLAVFGSMARGDDRDGSDLDILVTMVDRPPIARRRAVVGNPLGLHLRTARQFVRLAQRYAAAIRVRCDGAVAQGKSVLDLMGLAAGFGMVLELEAHGPDAEEAVIALADLISARPHEIEEHQVA